MSIDAARPETETLRLARGYAALGWSVVPVRPGEKLPAIQWAEFQHAPASDAHLADWFSMGGYGMGLIQGAVSGTVVLDFDGAIGQETRAALEREHGEFPHTIEAITPGGGCHVVFRHPGHNVPTRKNVLPGMDVRGDGGFIVAHPSQHANGRRYQWDIDHHPDEMQPAPCPTWAADLICGALGGGNDTAASVVQEIRPGPLGTSGAVITDGREAYMRDTVLAVLREQRDLLRRFPDLDELFQAVWPQYSRKVDLSRPGRGADEVLAKCRYTLARVTSGVLSIGPLGPEPVVKPEAEQQHDPETGEIIAFPATPLSSLNLDTIPPREWLYGRELLKGFVSVLGSPGGVGKTAYTLGVGFSVACDRPLLHNGIGAPGPFLHVHKPGPVWFYNLEDPSDEMRRRVKALLIHQKMTVADITHPVYVDSGRDRPLIITERQGATLVARPLVDDLVAELKRRGIVLLVVDPFVQSHTAEENRNEEMNLVMALWGKVAHQAQCAVWLVHHFRKGGQGGDAESFRGAGAIQGAARVMSTLSAMSVEEASKLGIEPDHRRQFIRLDNAKANMAPSADRAEWYKLVSIKIGNASLDYPDGDSVQSVEPWEPPSPWEGLSWATIQRVLDQIETGPTLGERYADNKAAKDRWAGKVLIEMAGKTEGQASQIIKAWVETGLLEKGQYTSPARKGATSSCVSVNPIKAAEMLQGAPGASSDE